LPEHQLPPVEVDDPAYRIAFEERVLQCPMSGCHLWTGAGGLLRHMSSGEPFADYGNVSVPSWKRSVGAHRMAWWLYRGTAIPYVIAHRCDVRVCVNPDHLFLATDKENMADCFKKGRHPTNLGKKLKRWPGAYD
jgi:hypothetical protein